jgi:cytochrome P450
MSLKLIARHGDPLTQLLTIDTERASNIYPLIEQIRGLGRTSPLERAGWVAADAQIVREVLRDGRRSNHPAAPTSQTPSTTADQ